jgi:hypothetical protein
MRRPLAVIDCHHRTVRFHIGPQRIFELNDFQLAEIMYWRLAAHSLENSPFAPLGTAFCKFRRRSAR